MKKMFKFVRPSVLPKNFGGTRWNSTKPPLPFSEEALRGDDQYSEVNNFYSDMFTQIPASTQMKLDDPVDELAELNAEMNELYGLNCSRTLLSQIQENTPKIFISSHTNPYRNLALEEYIFQNTPKDQQFHAHRLIFYTNSPCVVIGKNQNPWKEANVPLLNSLQIPLLRRRSGGGTVVHDLKNVNYSYITTRDSFNRSYFGKLIVDQINKSRLAQLKQNERGDITTIEGKKVSGSAYKVSKGMSYHHGTMLLNSNLEVLRSLLNTKQRHGVVEFRCNSVDSVPAPVTNIGIENEEFINAVSDGFIDLYPNLDLIEVDELPEEVLSIAQELEEWDWRFGNTPKFEMDIQCKDFKITFMVEKGCLKDFNVDKDESQFKFLRQVLENGEKIQFKGEAISGFIIDDDISGFIGDYIDGSN
jgi:lipoate-protein ligase A